MQGKQFGLWTIALGMAVLLTGCDGGGNPLKTAQDTLSGESGKGLSSGGGGKAVVIGGMPGGPVFEEIAKQYQITGGDVSGCDALIVNGPSFPGKTLKDEPIVKKAMEKRKEIILLNVSGEQKEAALKGHIVTWTTNQSLAYDVQFTQDSNGRPSVRAVDMPVSHLTADEKHGKSRTRAAAATGLSAASPEAERAGAQMFVQAMRGQAPGREKTRAVGDNTSPSIDAGAQYTRDTIVTVGEQVVPDTTYAGPGTNDPGIDVPATTLHMFATHEVVAIKLQGAQTGAGYRAVLYTDGYYHSSPPALQTGGAGGYDTWAYYPVAVSNNIDVVPFGDNVPPGSFTVQSSPNSPAGETDNITDATSFSIKSNGFEFNMSSSQTRTLTDWGFTPTNQTGMHAGYLFGQQVPYRWDKPPTIDRTDPLGNVSLFALGGFAFHTTTSVASNVIYTGGVSFNGTLVGTSHGWVGPLSTDEKANTRALPVWSITTSYTIKVDWSSIPNPPSRKK